MATGKKRSSSTATRKTTARKGTTKSAQARAVSHEVRSSSAGRANQTPGESRTVGKPALPRRTERGPGDVGVKGRR